MCTLWATYRTWNIILYYILEMKIVTTWVYSIGRTGWMRSFGTCKQNDTKTIEYEENTDFPENRWLPSVISLLATLFPDPKIQSSCNIQCQTKSIHRGKMSKISGIQVFHSHQLMIHITFRITLWYGEVQSYRMYLPVVSSYSVLLLLACCRCRCRWAYVPCIRWYLGWL